MDRSKGHDQWFRPAQNHEPLMPADGINLAHLTIAKQADDINRRISDSSIFALQACVSLPRSTMLNLRVRLIRDWAENNDQPNP